MKIDGRYYYVALDLPPERVKLIHSGEASPWGKRTVPKPTDEERRSAQGACAYGCRQGHAWLLFVVRESLVREGGDPAKWLPVDGADRYCVECKGVSDEEALGKRISATRHWTLRAPRLPFFQPPV